MSTGPFERQAGRLLLEHVDVADVAQDREGHPCWLVSVAAVADVVAGIEGPRTVAVGDVGPLGVLRQLAAAGWWAAVCSSHELTLAATAGFEAAHRVVTGRHRDDGLLKDALLEGVAVVAVSDADDERNVARIARHLECAVPPATGQPPAFEAGAWPICGGLLAPLVRGPPDLVLDAPLPALPGEGVLDVLPVAAGGEPQPVTVTGLSRSGGAPASSARLHGEAERGAWVVVPHPAALALRPRDPVHVEPAVVLVREGLWREDEPRPWPALEE